MGEFELIAAIKQLCTTLPTNDFEGIGDDCAILEIGGGESLVFTSDALCEGVHFLRAATSAHEIGHKTLAVNLSDVAAMGVRPIAVLLSLSLPEGLPEGWIEAFMDGFTTLARQHNVALVGGDTTRSEHGIILNVTAIGRGPSKHLKRRRDARVGDIILVSDRLGGSAAGLKAILSERYDTLAAHIHRTPQPEVEVGAWLGAREEVHAMMDISDGIASDLRHILTASQVGAEVELTAIPLDEGATIDEATTGGEDYKLLLTVEAERCTTLQQDFEAQFHRPLYPIGRITHDGLIWRRNNIAETRDLHGFCHF